MTRRLSVLTAAKIADETYRPSRGRIAGYRILSSSKGHATAYLLEGDILTIKGSDSAYDYIRYNLRPLGIGFKKLTLKGKMGQGADWHQGFLAHVAEIQTWLIRIRRRPKYIIGHSLGAASAQVFSAALQVPAICFAPPRVCRQNKIPGQWNRCLLIARTDDIVPQIPEGYQHIGRSTPIDMGRVLGHKHKMKHYIPQLPKQINKGKIPSKWP